MEIAQSPTPAHEVDNDLRDFNARFGFAELRPVSLVSLEYQIAQKIHAVTDPAYARAHDLVDLQLLWQAGPDLVRLRALCERTFNWRKGQPWPPLPLRSMDRWDLAYLDARSETEVAGHSKIKPTLASARQWLGMMVSQIEQAKSGE
jgi:hypothetical protein